MLPKCHFIILETLQRLNRFLSQAQREKLEGAFINL